MNLSGQWYAGACMDIAWLTLYRHPYASTANDARLSGSGVFLSWQGAHDWQGKITLSRPFGSPPAQLSGTSYAHTQAWVELSKAYR